MGLAANNGITQIDPAVDDLRDGADAINRLGDELISGVIGRVWKTIEAASVTSLVNATWTNVLLDSVQIDDFGGLTPPFDAATGGFKVPAAGRYEIQGVVGFASSPAAGTHRGACICINGTNQDGGQGFQLGGIITLALLIPTPVLIIDCALNDIISLRGYQDTGANRNTNTAAGQRSAMTVRRIK